MQGFLADEPSPRPSVTRFTFISLSYSAPFPYSCVVFMSIVETLTTLVVVLCSKEPMQGGSSDKEIPLSGGDLGQFVKEYGK